MIDPSIQTEIVNRRSQGQPIKRIAEELKLPVLAVLDCVQQNKAQIDRLYAEYIKDVFVQCGVDAQSRAKFLAKIYHKLMCTIDHSALDPADPTHRKLIELFLRIHQTLVKEQPHTPAAPKPAPPLFDNTAEELADPTMALTPKLPSPELAVRTNPDTSAPQLALRFPNLQKSCSIRNFRPS